MKIVLKVLLYINLLALVLVGYIQNIVTLCGMNEVNGETAVRVIGIFMPLIGAIYGWF